jgi:Zn-dependent protease
VTWDYGGRRLIMGVPREAFRPSPIFLLLLALTVAGGVLAWYDIRIGVFLFVLAGWLVTLCLHEYAHAIVAFRAGDTSVAHRGYLTLNPLKYTHPLLSIVLPILILVLGGIGLPGGAVWVDRHAVRGGRKVHSLISLSGPLTNGLFAVLLMLPFLLGAVDVLDIYEHAMFWSAVAFLGFLQIVALLLNLLPIPGLDGGNLIEPWLSGNARRTFELFAPYGMLIVFALLMIPQVGGAFFDFARVVEGALGMPSDVGGGSLSLFGYYYFQFWR